MGGNNSSENSSGGKGSWIQNKDYATGSSTIRFPISSTDILKENESTALDLPRSKFLSMFNDATSNVDKIIILNNANTVISYEESQQFPTNTYFRTLKKETESYEKIQKNTKTNLNFEETTRSFLGIILQEQCEPEYTSNTERFILTLLSKDRLGTLSWLNGLFLKYFENKNFVVNVLTSLSHIDYTIVDPSGPTMAGFAFQHKSIEVRESAIRAFESWANEKSLDYLKIFECKEKWLNDYLLEVIADIERELNENVSTCPKN